MDIGWIVLILGIIFGIVGFIGCVVFVHPAYHFASVLLIAIGGWMFICAMDYLRGK